MLLAFFDPERSAPWLVDVGAKCRRLHLDVFVHLQERPVVCASSQSVRHLKASQKRFAGEPWVQTRTGLALSDVDGSAESTFTTIANFATFTKYTSEANEFYHTGARRNRRKRRLDGWTVFNCQSGAIRLFVKFSKDRYFRGLRSR